MSNTHPALALILIFSALSTFGCSPESADPWPTPRPDIEGEGASAVEAHAIPLGSWDKPGLNIRITGLAGATGAEGAFQPGDMLSFVFTLEDDAKKAYRLDEITQLNFMVSGPTEDLQPVFLREDSADVAQQAIHLGSGRYEYQFPQPIPEVYSAPYHDTTDLGAQDGEAQGLALQPGTYALLHQGNIHWPSPETGEIVDEHDGLTLFTISTKNTSEFTQKYDANACHACHTVGPEPGTNEASAATCAVCHTPGAEDGGSEINSAFTPGFTLEMGPFFHKLHMGQHLGNLPLEVYGAPSEEEPYGVYYDFSFVDFPAQPGGIKNCETCHSSNADPAWKDGASRAACGSCHDWINWEQEEDHPQGGLQVDDSQCSQCHPSAGPSSILAVHQIPQKDPELNPGLRLTVRTLKGASGAGGYFKIGDVLSFTYSLTDGNASPLSLSNLESGAVVLSGPNEHKQPVFKHLDLPDLIQGSTPSATEPGLYEYKLPPLPATYAAPYNDSPSFGHQDGEWQGQALVAGTYSLGLYATALFEDIDRQAHRTASPMEVRNIQILAQNSLSVPAIIDSALCATCHLDTQYHEGKNIGANGCVLCHTSGAEDLPSEPGSAVHTIEFSSLMHKVHRGNNLSQPFTLRAQKGDITFDGLFPAWPDRTRQCIRCHVNDSHENASARACLSCHDTSSAQSHVESNTANGIESCDVCHGPGKDNAVSPSHGLY